MSIIFSFALNIGDTITVRLILKRLMYIGRNIPYFWEMDFLTGSMCILILKRKKLGLLQIMNI